jgi:DNA-binding GntR family transcriptional regulator
MGELKPGERVVETRIARELSVSQAPVREAILELEQMGLITIRPYQGAFVREPSHKDIKESYLLRALLEGEAAREACLVITPEELEELSDVFESMQDIAKKGDIQQYISQDILFHQRIMEIAGNRLMMKVWQQIHMANTTFITLNVTKRDVMDIAGSHGIILDALRNRQCEKAQEIMRNHLHEVMDDVLKQMKIKD